MSVTFLQILKFISSFKGDLPANWEDITLIIGAVRRIAERFNQKVQADEPGVLQSQSFTLEEHAELDAIADALGGPTAAVDLSGLIAFGSLLKSTGGKAVAMLLWKILSDYLDQKG